MTTHLRGIRILYYQRSFKKRKFKILAVVWFLLLLLLSVTVLNTGTSVSYERRKHPVKDDPSNPTSRANVPTNRSNLEKGVTESGRYDILINSYQRSGSSFTGQLLAFQPDTFYWYEPVWYWHGLLYLMGRYVCIGKNMCGDFGSESTEDVNKLLFNIYSCNFTDLAHAVAENMTAQYSGAVWEPYLSCQARGQPKSVCLKTMEDVCKVSKQRATKIVRLTVDNLEYILDRNTNLKVIHLIRDPRAIINSQTTTKWYNMSDGAQNDHKLIRVSAQDLCIRMKYDLEVGEKLKQKHPDRFAFVMFEDLQDDLISKTELLYSYFGMDKSTVKTKAANLQGILQGDHTVKRNRGDYTNWWRFQLNFSTVKVIDEACESVLSFLGYRQFTSEAEMKNLSLNAYSLRNELLISGLYRNKLYDFKILYTRRPHRRLIDVIPKHGNQITDFIEVLI